MWLRRKRRFNRRNHYFGAETQHSSLRRKCQPHTAHKGKVRSLRETSSHRCNTKGSSMPQLPPLEISGLHSIKGSNKDRTLFHGSNKRIDIISAGSWITDNLDVATDFAKAKSDRKGGSPHIMTIQVEDTDIDWDFASIASGIDDLRGTLLKCIPIKTYIQLS